MGEDVCSQEQAWHVWEQLLSDQRFSFWNEPSLLDAQFRSLTTDKRITPKLWNDAYLAAFALASSRRLVTFDKGFAQFEKLGLDLLIENPSEAS